MIPNADLSGIIIYGAGRHFSSGADLKDLLDSVQSGPDSGSSPFLARSGLLYENLNSFRLFHELDIPVIAAIRGVCLGSALELALFCHARICGKGSVLGLPETGFGLIPGCGGIQNLNALAGKSRALELILSGTSFTAEEALNWKIVDKIVSKKDIVKTAIQTIKNAGPVYNRFSIRSRIDKYLG